MHFSLRGNRYSARGKTQLIDLVNDTTNAADRHNGNDDKDKNDHEDSCNDNLPLINSPNKKKNKNEDIVVSISGVSDIRNEYVKSLLLQQRKINEEKRDLEIFDMSNSLSDFCHVVL